MLLTINIIICVLAVLLYGGLFVVVTLSKPLTDAKRMFRLYLLATVFWSIAALLVYADQTRSLFWFRMMSLGGLMTVVPVFRISRSLINVRNNWDIAILIFIIIAISISLGTDLVFETAYVEGGVIHKEFGPLFYPLVLVPGGGIMLYSIVIMIRTYRRSLDPIEQNRLLYLILGIGAMVLASSLNIIPALGRYPVDIATNSIAALLFFFAILRYQLLDVRVVIRQGLVYSFPTIIIGTTYFLVINFTLNLFNVYAGIESSLTVNIEIYALSLLVAVLTAIVAEPLRERAQRIIDRMRAPVIRVKSRSPL